MYEIADFGSYGQLTWGHMLFGFFLFLLALLIGVALRARTINLQNLDDLIFTNFTNKNYYIGMTIFAIVFVLPIGIACFSNNLIHFDYVTYCVIAVVILVGLMTGFNLYRDRKCYALEH
jgi:hypothetical protein